VRLTRVTATAANGAAGVVHEALLADALWAAAQPEDRLEHISLQFRPDDIVIGIFTRGDDASSAEMVVRGLMKRVCEISPAFRTWQMTDIRRLPTPSDPSRENDL
jgi:hypothetical protein